MTASHWLFTQVFMKNRRRGGGSEVGGNGAYEPRTLEGGRLLRVSFQPTHLPSAELDRLLITCMGGGS